MNLHNLLHESLPYISQYGPLIIFFGALIEGETTILLAGVLCHQGILPLEWTVIAASMGGFTGDQIWFYLGQRYGKKLLLRFPRLTRYTSNTHPWLKKKTDWIAAGSRFVYGTRTIAPIFLGMDGFSSLRFVFINSVSASLWAMIGIGIGFSLGASAEQLFGGIKHIELLLLGIILMMLLIQWYRHSNLKRKSNTDEKHV